MPGFNQSQPITHASTPQPRHRQAVSLGCAVRGSEVDPHRGFRPLPALCDLDGPQGDRAHLDRNDDGSGICDHRALVRRHQGALPSVFRAVFFPPAAVEKQPGLAFSRQLPGFRCLERVGPGMVPMPLLWRKDRHESAAEENRMV